MNLFHRIQRRWNRLRWPHATEKIAPGQLVTFTDATRTKVKPVPLGNGTGVAGIALNSAKKGDGVEVLQCGSVTF